MSLLIIKYLKSIILSFTEHIHNVVRVNINPCPYGTTAGDELPSGNWRD